jgi:hypothetical protein
MEERFVPIIIKDPSYSVADLENKLGGAYFIIFYFKSFLLSLNMYKFIVELRRGSMVRAVVAGARAHAAPVLDPPL